MLGQVDLDDFVDSHVETAQEFEDNFKAVRARRKEAEKLPETIKVSASRGDAPDGAVFSSFSFLISLIMSHKVYFHLGSFFSPKLVETLA